MDVILSDLERSCLHKLASIFNSETGHWSFGQGFEAIGLTKENYIPVLRTFEDWGIIEKVTHATTGLYSFFKVNAKAVQMIRVMSKLEDEAKERLAAQAAQIQREDRIASRAQWFQIYSATLQGAATIFAVWYGYTLSQATMQSQQNQPPAIVAPAKTP